ERRDLAARLEHELPGQIAFGDGRDDLGDASHLAREIERHRVDALRELLPRAGYAGDLGLAAKLPFRPDLARDARDLPREGPGLVDLRVERVLQLEDLALGLHRDLLRQVPVRDRRRDQRDVAHLVGQVPGEHVHIVGEVPPRAADTRNTRLTAELPVDADLARDRGDLIGEGPERGRHAVDGVRQRRDLALRLDHELLRQVAVRDRGDDLGDPAHLVREVAGHQVHAVREVLPGAGDVLDVGLPAQLALGADLARDAGHLRGKRAEPIDHRVDGALQLQDLALRGDGDLRGQVAVRDRGGDERDVSDLLRQVAREHVDGVREVLPRAGDALDVGLGPEAPLAADLARDARDLRRERAQLFDRGVQRVLQLEDLALRLDGDVLREVALRDGARDLRDVADLR